MAVILAGCVGRTPESSFYTFAPGTNCAGDDGACVTHAVAPMTVDVARVRIAEYIDRPQMVTQDGVTVHMAQDNRWAEGLGPMVGRRLISELSTRLPAATVKDAAFAGVAPDRTVFVEIYQMDGTLGKTARLSAVYGIAKDGEPGRPHAVNYVVPVGNTYADYATACGQMIDRMAAEIARDVAGTK